MDRRSWTMLLALGAIWGASYMFIKIGLRDLSPEAIAFVRIALAALILVPIAWSQGALGSLRGLGWWLLVIGAVQVAAPFVLIGAGEQEISSGLAGILVATTPMFTALLAIWVDHEERSQGMRLVGVATGFAGVALLLGIDLGGSRAELIGGLMVVLAGLGYAVGALTAKHKLADVPPIAMSAGVMTASTIALIPAAIAGAPSEAPGLGPLAAVVTLGVVGTGFAFIILYSLISTVGPARTWLVTYIAPLFAVVYGSALLGESITPATVAGMALILGGSWLAAEGRLPGSRDELADGSEEASSLPAAEPEAGAAYHR
jgi:drug/metabolite transporter (DMT)-like permease